jgi:hypothetical protein
MLKGPLCLREPIENRCPMKNTLLYIIAAALLASCASGPRQTSTNSRKQSAKKIDENDKPPFIGMTKAQAIARYGEPDKKTVTPEGEQWRYVLNMGEFVGKHMIPFFFSSQQLRFGFLIFGPDGKVKQFQWDKPNS